MLLEYSRTRVLCILFGKESRITSVTCLLDLVCTDIDRTMLFNSSQQVQAIENSLPGNVILRHQSTIMPSICDS